MIGERGPSVPRCLEASGPPPAGRRRLPGEPRGPRRDGPRGPLDRPRPAAGRRRRPAADRRGDITVGSSVQPRGRRRAPARRRTTRGPRRRRADRGRDGTGRRRRARRVGHPPGSRPGSSRPEPAVAPVPASPEIVRFRPRDGWTDVDRNAQLSVRFTTAMDHATTEAAFHATLDGADVAGSIRWAEGDTVLVLRPSTALPYGARVELRVDGGALSAAGSAVLAAAAASFTVEARPAASERTGGARHDERLDLAARRTDHPVLRPDADAVRHPPGHRHRRRRRRPGDGGALGGRDRRRLRRRVRRAPGPDRPRRRPPDLVPPPLGDRRRRRRRGDGRQPPRRRSARRAARPGSHLHFGVSLGTAHSSIRSGYPAAPLDCRLVDRGQGRSRRAPLSGCAGSRGRPSRCRGRASARSRPWPGCRTGSPRGRTCGGRRRATTSSRRSCSTRPGPGSGR